jgi:hypothetical protein
MHHPAVVNKNGRIAYAILPEGNRWLFIIRFLVLEISSLNGFLIRRYGSSRILGRLLIRIVDIYILEAIRKIVRIHTTIAIEAQVKIPLIASLQMIPICIHIGNRGTRK